MGAIFAFAPLTRAKRRNWRMVPKEWLRNVRRVCGINPSAAPRAHRRATRPGRHATYPRPFANYAALGAGCLGPRAISDRTTIVPNNSREKSCRFRFPAILKVNAGILSSQKGVGFGCSNCAGADIGIQLIWQSDDASSDWINALRMPRL